MRKSWRKGEGANRQGNVGKKLKGGERRESQNGKNREENSIEKGGCRWNGLKEIGKKGEE